MTLPFAAWFFLLATMGMMVIIWLPYFWSPAGYYLRRSEGPWLINFDRTRLAKAIIRDILYTIGIVSGFLLIRIFVNTPYFWLIAAIGLCSIFGNAFLSDSLETYNKATPAIRLFSTVPFTPQALRQFLASVGALIPGKQQPYIGRLSYSGGYVWINNFTAIFAKVEKRLLQHHNQERAEYEAYQARLRSSLGSEVRSVLFISIMKAKDMHPGERAAMEFIGQFAQQYPCVVEDAYGNLLRGQEIQEALDRNRLVLDFQKRIAEGTIKG
jgi:hypothetical protein